MAKLYFRFGSVGGAKTLNLLAVAHNYKQQGKKIILIKPELDDRFGYSLIKSRAGLQSEADILVTDTTHLSDFDFEGISCVLVDEAQFLSPYVVEQLRDLTLTQGIPVLCYGLKTDFRSKLFDGSKRLLELADSIEEVKSTCYYCNRKAIMNLKCIDGKATLEGPTVDLGAEEKYHPTCYSCYRKNLKKSAPEPALAGA